MQRTIRTLTNWEIREVIIDFDFSMHSINVKSNKNKLNKIKFFKFKNIQNLISNRCDNHLLFVELHFKSNWIENPKSNYFVVTFSCHLMFQ